MPQTVCSITGEENTGGAAMSRSALAQSTLEALCAVAAARGALSCLADPDRGELAPAAAAALSIVENELDNAAAALNTLAGVLRLRLQLGAQSEEPAREEHSEEGVYHGALSQS